jgi:hypothetical protein
MMTNQTKRVLECSEDSSSQSKKLRITNAGLNMLDITNSTHNVSSSPSDKITLNVGGTRFVTTLATLSWQQEWVLGSCHLKHFDTSHELFFDADPDVFAWILRQFRCRQRLPFPVHDTTPNNFIRQQLDFWGLFAWWKHKELPFSVSYKNILCSTLLEKAVQFFLDGHALDFTQSSSLKPKRVKKTFTKLLFSKSEDIDALLGSTNGGLEQQDIEIHGDVEWFGEWVGMWLPTMTLEAAWCHQNVGISYHSRGEADYENLTECLKYYHCCTAKELLARLQQPTQEDTDADDFEDFKKDIKDYIEQFQNTQPGWVDLHEHARSVYAVMQNSNHVEVLRAALLIHGMELTVREGTPNAIFHVHVSDSFVEYGNYGLMAHSKYNIATKRVYVAQRR